MPQYHDHDSETTTYDQAGLLYTGLSGITVAGVSQSSVFIPMKLTTHTSPIYTKSFTAQPVIPNYDQRGGLAYGGNVLIGSGQQFPKISLEGTIDVDLVGDTEIAPYAGEAVQVPNVQVNGIPLHWIDVLAMFFEGRFNGARYDPAWYRDPYGRIYNSPRIYDLTGTYTIGTPQRANFTMTLLLPTSAL